MNISNKIIDEKKGLNKNDIDFIITLERQKVKLEGIKVQAIKKYLRKKVYKV